MFNIIKPKDHVSYSKTTDAFLDLLKVCQGFDFTSEQKYRSYFIIPEAQEEGVYGGAVIYPQKIASSLKLEDNDTNEDKVIKLTSAFQPKGHEYWVARIFLYIQMGSSAAAILESQDICHRFYQNLYKEFVTFGAHKDVDYLAHTIRILETYNIKTYELWPYQLGIVVDDPDYGFAHGILSLKGKRFKARPYPKSGREL